MYRKLSCLTVAALVLAVAGSAGAQVGQGKVLFEYWFGGGVDSNLDNLKANANFPNNPAQSEWRDGMDRPDWAGQDYWGARARAFLTAPETGDYTFWIASDDDSELWLSTDEDPAKAVEIASVEGWTNYRKFTEAEGAPGPNRQSAPVKLEAGKKYYIEGLMSDGTGGGHMSVAWGGPAGIGAGPVVIPAAQFTAFIRDPEPLFMATAPKPADGAVDVTQPLFEWTAGMNAVLHDIYFGTNPTPGAAEYKGPMPVAMYFHVEPLVPGQKYYWRVDEIEATGALRTGKVWSFTVMPLEAHVPTPADGAKDIGSSTQLKWTAGQNATMHALYFGIDKALVTAGDASVKLADQAETTYDLTGLDGFSTYYWRVDETDASGKVSAGPVWTFSTVSYLPIADDVVTLNYDNSADPFVSATIIDKPGDWTAGGVSDLFMRFQGATGMVGGFTADAATGTYTVSGAGTDIWGNADQFQYVYKTLNGDATMVARVTAIGTGTNTWAKGGVMIRDSLEAGSTHAYMPITANSDGSAGNGASFQRRLVANLASTNNDSAVKVAPPYWVKIERVGNAFSGFISPDGQTWTQLGSAQTIAMTDPVHIGLAVTSHAAGQVRSFTFDSVSSTGAVTGEFATEQIGITYNSPQPIFAAVEDAAGKIGVVTHPDPAATMITSWWSWKIPVSEFAAQGVDLANVASVQLGVGDLLNPAADGKGVVKFDDVRVVLPVVIQGRSDITSPLDNVKGVPNDGDWPAAELPALAIDNQITTKFLHFKGELQPSGIQIEPMAGSTLVTGLTFTTANDAAERDPVTFELYGSNESLDGPYELIASGDIVDFAGETAWVRRTKTTTPIRFENETMYKFYQVLFPTLRGPATANSMQIAEIELLSGLGSDIVWVSFHGADDAPSNGAKGAGFTEAADKGYTDLLKAAGHKVTRYVQTGTPDATVLEAADLVIISRSVASGSFQNAAASRWNNLAVPIINVNGYTLRKNRLGFNTGNTIPDTTGDISLTVADPTHPIFAGVALADGTTGPFAGIVTYANGTLARGISIVTEPVGVGGTVLATVSAAGNGPAGAVVIAEFPAGTAMTHDGGDGTDILAGPRLMFLTGSREASGINSETAGMYDLSEDGAQMFLNAVKYMAAK